MRILITGNMGYVGPGVVAHLRAIHPGATLLGYDSGFFAHCLTGADGLPERRLDAQHFGDVRDLPPHLLEGVDAVVHLAAVSNDPIGNRYEDVTMRINHEATVEVARRAREAGVRSFVMASSCSVYGAAEDGTPRDETSQVAPITAYARSKIASELDLEPLADDGFTVTCLRFATACGMSDRLRLDLVLNDFVAGAMASGQITVLSDGSPWRPLIHVSDMARAADWAVGRRSEDSGQFLAINVGRDDWNHQVRDLAAAVADAVPGTDVSINTDAPADPRSYRVSFARYRDLAPDHQPHYDLERAVVDIREGLDRMGFRDPDFRSSPLMRLHVLEGLRTGGLLDEDLSWTSGTRATPVAAAV
jgi:nucleoside-diphosphate-sugar epimerase